MRPGELLMKTASTLRELSARVTELEKELADRTKLEQAEKLAMQMSEKGMLSKDEVKSKAADWIESEEDLEVLDRAVKVAETLPTSTWSGTAVPVDGVAGNPDATIEKWIMGLDT
jgi:hypothetical protein